VAIKNNHL